MNKVALLSMGAMTLIPVIVLLIGHAISKLKFKIEIKGVVFVRATLWVSFFYVLILVFITIFSIPAARHEFMRVSIFENVISLIYCLGLTGVLSWPWIAGFFASRKHENNLQIFIFSIASILVTSYFLLPKYTGSEEGVGFTVIILVLICWILYPVSMLFRFKKK